MFNIGMWETHSNTRILVTNLIDKGFHIYMFSMMIVVVINFLQ